MDPTATPTGGRRDSTARSAEARAETSGGRDEGRHDAAAAAVRYGKPDLVHRGPGRQRRPEGALDVCEAAFDSIVDKSADGVIVIDHQGTICFTNAAAEAMLGRATGELLGERFAIPVVPGKSAEIDIFEAPAPAANRGDARRGDLVAGKPCLSGDAPRRHRTETGRIQSSRGGPPPR